MFGAVRYKEQYIEELQAQKKNVLNLVTSEFDLCY